MQAAALRFQNALGVLVFCPAVILHQTILPANGGQPLIGVVPVSYTHLLLALSYFHGLAVQLDDIPGAALFAPHGADLTVHLDSTAPVSYTHLDVYKRQLQR